jgi:transcription elongation factor GreA
MMKRDYYLTQEGIEKLRIDLDELRGPRRKEIADRLRNAVQMGDLSENADYIKAKEDQAFVEGKIQELETVLRDAVIIEEGITSGVAIIGSTIIVETEGRDPETYRLVGIKEANSREGKISHESPIGKAVLGKKVGDTVKVTTPGGEIEILIREIQ